MDERLRNHLRDRPNQLQEASKNGIKVVGYFPGNYVPEEMIHAAGAIPLCLIHGGDSAPADTALSVVPRLICPFARYQIGEQLLKNNPYYNMIDLLVAPITCQHLKKVAEVWEYFGNLDIFKLGIPQKYDNDFELEYYTGRLEALKERLQHLTGNTISHLELSHSIDLYNRMRELLRQISLLRVSDPGIITSLDFIQLNHASFYADPVFMTDYLSSLYSELKGKVKSPGSDGCKLLLTGPNVSYGDYSVLELVKKAGGEIVIEEIYEGMRDYWHTISNEGDLMKSLTRGYLIDRTPCALMRNSARKRYENILQLIRDYDVSGVIWYELMCCETFDTESYYLSKKLAEVNIPMLILESDYSNSDSAQFQTRIEAFIEIVSG
ncbi:MAG: 2-hydroxyacyl-CoA dehydratase [Dehalococcoidales bacterium]|nr:2-hydroxyacyl-CoA dehydratase [Dehalococcoidales bacterium]